MCSVDRGRFLSLDLCRIVHNMGCMAPIGLLLHEADVAGMSIDCSRAGVALLLAFLHAIGRPGWVMRSKNAIGFIPRCKLQLPLMPRHLHPAKVAASGETNSTCYSAGCMPSGMSCWQKHDCMLTQLTGAQQRGGHTMQPKQ